MSTKVLISVKTYPTLSKRYNELVCTAGFLENGSWVRIYPLPFRALEYEQKYKKWQWIELDLERNYSDVRPESHKVPNLESLNIIEQVGTEQNWYKRKEIVNKRADSTHKCNTRVYIMIHSQRVRKDLPRGLIPQAFSRSIIH